MQQSTLVDKLISMFESYVEYKNINKPVNYIHNYGQYAYSCKINPQESNVSFIAHFKANDDTNTFSYNPGSKYKHMGDIKYRPTKKEAEDVLSLLKQNLYSATLDMNIWKDVLSQCYSLMYIHSNNKKVLYLYKEQDVSEINISIDNNNNMNEFTEIHYNYLKINSKNINVDISKLTINLSVDELHYYCECIDQCTCESLNLPDITSKFKFYTSEFKFCNNGNFINIPTLQFWQQYKSIKPCYTFKNKYIIVDDKGVTCDHNRYINDNFSDNTTGYFYRIDEHKLIITTFKDNNWPLTKLASVELIKVINEIVFIPNNIAMIEHDVKEIKNILNTTIKIKIHFEY